MGFVETDETLDACLTESKEFKMPCALRRLFATIMVFCECVNVRSLWDKHFESMAEDYRRSHGNSSLVEQMVLRDISHHVASMGRDIKSYGLPELDESGEVAHFN
jgi:hypothetical protein